MLSILLFIGTIIALLGGIAYFVFTYAPFIADIFNQIAESYHMIVVVLPSWLTPYALVPLILAGIGLLIKLL